MPSKFLFGFKVDDKLLPFVIEEFGDQCWVYGSDIPHEDRLYGAIDVSLRRDDGSEESKQKLPVDNTRASRDPQNCDWCKIKRARVKRTDGLAGRGLCDCKT
jgi:hypothetical protein